MAKLKEGWTTGESLKESDRFYARVLISPNGTRYLAKGISRTASDEIRPVLKGRFQNEVAFSQQYHGKLPFAVRRIVDLYEDGFLGTLFPGEALLKLAHTTFENLEPLIDTVADVAVTLILQVIPEEVRNQPVDIAESVLDARWLSGALELLRPGEFDKAMAAILQYQGSVHRGLTHGDLTWEHIFKGPDGQLALIALDGAGTEKPMLYDVAYDYTRIVTYGLSDDLGAQFLNRVYGQLNMSRDEFIAELRAPLIERTLGTLYDAKMDSESKTGEEREYRGRALEMHSRAVSGRTFDCIR